LGEEIGHSRAGLGVLLEADRTEVVAGHMVVVAQVEANALGSQSLVGSAVEDIPRMAAVGSQRRRVGFGVVGIRWRVADLGRHLGLLLLLVREIERALWEERLGSLAVLGELETRHSLAAVVVRKELLHNHLEQILVCCKGQHLEDSVRRRGSQLSLLWTCFKKCTSMIQVPWDILDLQNFLELAYDRR
jgi:hypothetical protein